MESVLNAKYEADDCSCSCVKNNTPSKDSMQNPASLQGAISNGWKRELLATRRMYPEKLVPHNDTEKIPSSQNNSPRDGG